VTCVCACEIEGRYKSEELRRVREAKSRLFTCGSKRGRERERRRHVCVRECSVCEREWDPLQSNTTGEYPVDG
jgi:hypothetical protein